MKLGLGEVKRIRHLGAMFSHRKHERKLAYKFSTAWADKEAFSCKEADVWSGLAF